MADELPECQLGVLDQFTPITVARVGSSSTVLKENDAIPRVGSIARRRIAFDGLYSKEGSKHVDQNGHAA